MTSEMSEEQWHPIDLWIFRGWTINAVKGIREAVDIAEARRLSLMNRFPEQFVAHPGFGGFFESAPNDA